MIESGNVLEDMVFPVANKVFGKVVKRKSADKTNQNHKQVVQPSVHDEAATCWEVPEHLRILPRIAEVIRIWGNYRRTYRII